MHIPREKKSSRLWISDTLPIQCISNEWRSLRDPAQISELPPLYESRVSKGDERFIQAIYRISVPLLPLIPLLPPMRLSYSLGIRTLLQDRLVHHSASFPLNFERVYGVR
jgi:hypothetical protein